MDGDILLPVMPPDRSLRAVARETLPFEVRVGVRRLPALARWALRAKPLRGDGGFEVASRSSPLRRAGTLYEPSVQAGKETNVARVAQALDRVKIAPRSRFSWNDTVGPPLVRRGFVPGPELQDGALVLGIGGGACQVANLVFWLGIMAGFTIVERHRHRWDLFPDDGREVPFGCGATVFWPHRDLVLYNPHPVGFTLHLAVREGLLHGAIHSDTALGRRYRLEQTAHRFIEHGGAIWRLNTVQRICEQEGVVSQEILVHNKARVAYPVPVEHLWSEP